MTAIVSNTNGADKYKVRLIFDIDIFENSQNTTSSQTENSVTETKLLGLRWNLRSMEKAV